MRSCDKVANYCFYCSHVRPHVYGDIIYFHDVVVTTQDKTYKDHYMFLEDKLWDFDVFFLRGQCIWVIRIIQWLTDSDYYKELHHAQDLFIALTNILIRLYINYVSKYFSKYQLTLRDVKIVYDAIYFFASELMHGFFKTNYIFFYEFLNIFEKFNSCHCVKMYNLKRKFGPYDNEPFRIILEYIVS